jgi:hypothetical protein
MAEYGLSGESETGLSRGQWGLEQQRKGITPTELFMDGQSYLCMNGSALASMIVSNGAQIVSRKLRFGQKRLLHVENTHLPVGHDKSIFKSEDKVMQNGNGILRASRSCPQGTRSARPIF